MAFGTGETKRFKSRFGMLFGVTPIIETCWPVINALGERFLYYRCEQANSFAKVKAALRHSNDKDTMREELRAAATKILLMQVPDSLDVPEDIQGQIAHMADFVARARTPVKRAGRTEEVEHLPAAEVGTRLAGQLIQLARGVAIARELPGVDQTVMDVIRHVALSGIPAVRLEALRTLWGQQRVMATQAVGQSLRMSSGTVRRALEDLWTLDLLDRIDDGSINMSHKWEISALARERLSATGLLG